MADPLALPRSSFLVPTLLIALAALGALVVVWALRPSTYEFTLVLATEAGTPPAEARVGDVSLGSTPVSIGSGRLAELSDPTLLAGGWPPRAPAGSRESSAGTSQQAERLIERVTFDTPDGATLLYLRIQEEDEAPQLYALSLDVRDALGRPLRLMGSMGSEHGAWRHARIEERLVFSPAPR